MTITLEKNANELAAKCVVCERTGRWAAALRGELRDSGIRIYETRSLDDCETLISDSPASLAIVELTAGDAVQTAETVSKWNAAHPRMRIVVVADRDQVEHEWLMREAGAIHFLVSPRRVNLVAQLVHRHFAQVPAPQLSALERIWASLPWPQHTEDAANS